MDFSKIVLKKTHTVDKSGPKTDGYDTKALDTFQKQIQELYMDAWYEKLKKYTFATEFIPITKVEAQIICKIHSRIDNTSSYQILDQEMKTLLNLTKTLDEKLEIFGSKAFCKMSSRSPKDVTNEKFDSICRKEIAKLGENHSIRDRIKAILVSSLYTLQVESSNDVLDLLIRSERVFDDFQEEFNRDHFNISIILREWKNIQVDLEFRGFVFQGHLNALSQYNCSAYFPDLVENKTKYQKLILDFFENIKETLATISTGNFIVDFCIIKDQVYFIELNTFDIASQACLFSWKNEMDLLTQGPFEFRIIETEIENMERMVPIEYQKYFTIQIQ